MKIPQLIDRLNEDIVEVLSHYLELKQQGTRYVACCPFHNEDTPSFMITPSKSMYKCFGCGKGGDTINFIQEHESVGFIEALKIGAKKLNLQVDFDKPDDFDTDEYKHLESLRIVLQKAAGFYQQALTKNLVASKYIKARGYDITPDNNPFQIGYAPKSNELLAWAKAENINLELLREVGLIKQNESADYDFFRDRIMFPICNKTGKVIGFTGRYIGKNTKAPKYLNSTDSPVFTKGEALFALNLSRQAISKHDRAYLTEGNFDVTRLHSLEINNTIAPCGTALTREQAKLLRNYTNKVTLIYDGDNAGRNAIMKNAEILIKEQFYVMVIALPDDSDPDDYFESVQQFEEYKDEHQTDYFFYKVEKNMSKFKNPSYKSDFIKDTSALLAVYDDSSVHEVYVEELGKLLKPKKAWLDQLKNYVADKAPVEKKSYIPKQVDLAEYQELGFYVDHNCYYFSNKGEPVQRSNFVMTPLFHFETDTDAKRIYEVKNIHGMTRVIEIHQKELGSLSAFRIRIESLGNFWFEGTEADLQRLKRWLYEKTKTCKEIRQLGWQKEGFWAWGNGIFNGEFKGIDKYGIVEHNEKNYYIPAFSQIFEKDESLYVFDRKFINMESNITLREYAKKYVDVFGDNGRIALTFYIASLFRDIIHRRFENFPLLNMFGPKGAGKNACADMLLYFFGKKQNVPNIFNASGPAIADHVSTSVNALCVLDEYRNDIDVQKREQLKAMWAGTGRTKMNMDKDKKKETTPVEQAIILCGQQMATADIALFTRFIMLGFSKVEFSDQEKERFQNLLDISRRGLTQITNRIIRLRPIFLDRYKQAVEKTANKMTKFLGKETVETRIFNNYLMVFAAYIAIADELELPWDEDEHIQLAARYMISQNSVIKKNDDLGQFWSKVEMLANSNLIFEGGDFKIVYTDTVTHRYGNKTGEVQQVEWNEPKYILYLTTSRVFSLYKKHSNQEGEKPLPESTVQYYLENSKAYLFTTKKEPFKKIDPKTGMQEHDTEGRKKRTSTTAMAFDYEKVGIDIRREEDPDDEQQQQINAAFGTANDVSEVDLNPPSTPQQKINMKD